MEPTDAPTKRTDTHPELRRRERRSRRYPADTTPRPLPRMYRTAHRPEGPCPHAACRRSRAGDAANHPEQAKRGRGLSTATTAQTQTGAGTEFLQAIFQPGDCILIRPIETWNRPTRNAPSRVDYKWIQYTRAGPNVGNVIKRHNERSEQTKANIFYGVCPRFGGAGQYVSRGEKGGQFRGIRGPAPRRSIAAEWGPGGGRPQE